MILVCHYGFEYEYGHDLDYCNGQGYNSGREHSNNYDWYFIVWIS